MTGHYVIDIYWCEHCHWLSVNGDNGVSGR